MSTSGYTAGRDRIVLLGSSPVAGGELQAGHDLAVVVHSWRQDCSSRRGDLTDNVGLVLVLVDLAILISCARVRAARHSVQGLVARDLAVDLFCL